MSSVLALQATRAGGSETGAEDNLESARARLRFWDLTLAQIKDLEASRTPHRTVTLHSPIGGYVTLKPVSQGMYVTPEMELYTVTELGTVWVWAATRTRSRSSVPGRRPRSAWPRTRGGHAPVSSAT